MSETVPSLLLRAGQNSTTDLLHQGQRYHDRAKGFQGNGAEAPIQPVTNAHTHLPPTEPDLTPSASNGSDEGTAIFPYIPRKRQERNGLLIDYLYLPAPNAAGDQVDFLILGENRLGVLLADVSGKISHDSLPIIKTALRSNSAGLSTAATLRYLDQRLSEIKTNGLAITAFYAIFDQNKRLLHFASAGHLPMLLYRPATGKVFLLNTCGAPLGVEMNGNPDANGATKAILQDLPASPSNQPITNMNTLKSERVALRHNDLLVLYSDGLLATRNSQGEFFGRQRFVEFVRKFGDLGPNDFIIELKRALEKFSGNQPTTDDITVIVLKNILRDLDKPHPEAAGYELESRFLTTDEEQGILEILRENPNAQISEILGCLSGGEYAYLQSEQIEAYLAQLGRWLQPWQDRNGRMENRISPALAVTRKSDSPGRTASAKKQFHENLLAAFPIQPLLHKQYEFRGTSSEVAQALRYYENGAYEQALVEFTRLRPNMRNSASMHCFFGNLQLLLNAPAKAQHEYLMALQLDPRCVHALIALSYIALLQEDYAAAIDSITTALRFNKNLTMYEKFAEKLIAAVERLENRNEWIV
ncbi:MAG: SpoIIE family protein phosphatase [candidate division KSB1 bacterium]|nr:SpoIIE family protein phosphatase [candidate division KSB1 bacterium]MDZ7304666.1 SpoIIE family protein phosphatase [candidate division KSB1 bacterium]MDZ7313802.1 SpoIIE family protein phosphatase [candidate division KSB1 bacterium]